MYIGPWQEFKLARILQIKDKVDKEAEQANRIDGSSQSHMNMPGGHSDFGGGMSENGKAYSV
jgi:hypothetical protein